MGYLESNYEVFCVYVWSSEAYLTSLASGAEGSLETTDSKVNWWIEISMILSDKPCKGLCACLVYKQKTKLKQTIHTVHSISFFLIFLK